MDQELPNEQQSNSLENIQAGIIHQTQNTVATFWNEMEGKAYMPIQRCDEEETSLMVDMRPPSDKNSNAMLCGQSWPKTDENMEQRNIRDGSTCISPKIGAPHSNLSKLENFESISNDDKLFLTFSKSGEVDADTHTAICPADLQMENLDNNVVSVNDVDTHTANNGSVDNIQGHAKPHDKLQECMQSSEEAKSANGIPTDSPMVCHGTASNGNLEVLDHGLLLCRAAFMGRILVIELCLQQPTINLAYTDTTGRNALHFAAAAGHVEAMYLLLEHLQNNVAKMLETGHLDSSTDDIINKRDPKGWTPLHVAICRVCPKIVEMLLTVGADPTIPLLHNSAPCRIRPVESPSIHFAAIRRSTEILEMLIGRGVSVNTKDADLRTPLHYAAYRGDPNIVEYLLQNDAFVNEFDIHRRTPLHSAVLSRQLANAKRLVQAGAVVAAGDVWDLTPLSLAVASEDEEMIKFLSELNESADATKAFTEVTLRGMPAASAILPKMGIVDIAVATTLITGLQEPKVAQVYRAVYRLGSPKCLEYYQRSLDVNRGSGMMTQSGDRQKTLGGIFFTLMKNELSPKMENRDIAEANKTDVGADSQSLVECKEQDGVKPSDGVADWKYIVQENNEALKFKQLKRRAARRREGIEQRAMKKENNSRPNFKGGCRGGNGSQKERDAMLHVDKADRGYVKGDRNGVNVGRGDRRNVSGGGGCGGNGDRRNVSDGGCGGNGDKRR